MVGSVINAVKSIKEEKMTVADAYAVVDRMEGATEALQNEGVKLHSLLTIKDIAENLFVQKLISQDVLKQVQDRIKVKGAAQSNAFTSLIRYNSDSSLQPIR